MSVYSNTNYDDIINQIHMLDPESDKGILIQSAIVEITYNHGECEFYVVDNIDDINDIIRNNNITKNSDTDDMDIDIPQKNLNYCPLIDIINGNVFIVSYTIKYMIFGKPEYETYGFFITRDELEHHISNIPYQKESITYDLPVKILPDYDDKKTYNALIVKDEKNKGMMFEANINSSYNLCEVMDWINKLLTE